MSVHFLRVNGGTSFCSLVCIQLPAILKRSTTTKNVVMALIKFFTQVGLPAVVQTDQGSNFTYEMFGQVMRTLGIKQVKSSIFHSQSQGALKISITLL